MFVLGLVLNLAGYKRPQKTALSKAEEEKAAVDSRDRDEIAAAMKALHMDHADLKGSKLSWMTASQLVRAYESNEIFADSVFKHHLFAVKGRIANIGKDILGSPYITLAGPDGVRGQRTHGERSDP